MRLAHFYRQLIFGAIFVALIVLPHVLDEYNIYTINQIACFALFALSFNMLFAYGGLLSFGQAAYFGSGAYCTVLLLHYIPKFPLLLAILLGALVAGLGAFLIGAFCVRMTGAYFALLTLAFSQFLYAIAFKWRSFTGGDDGLPMPNVHIIGSLDTSNILTVYYLIITLSSLTTYACWHLLKTPFGNAVRCVKINEERSSFLGFNPFWTKLILFTVGGIVAGIAGSLFMVNEKFVSADVIDLHRSTMCLLMAFIGGTGAFLGPILGAIIYVYLSDWLSGYTAYWELLLGSLFILIVLYFKEGFVSIFYMSKLKKLFLLGKG